MQNIVIITFCSQVQSAHELRKAVYTHQAFVRFASVIMNSLINVTLNHPTRTIYYHVALGIIVLSPQ